MSLIRRPSLAAYDPRATQLLLLCARISQPATSLLTSATMPVTLTWLTVRACTTTDGETPFASWRAVVTKPAVAAALSVQHAADEPPMVMVLGSALGYMCLFFRAMGVTCRGVDLLAESMIGVATDVINQHGMDGMGVEFCASDALEALQQLAQPPCGTARPPGTARPLPALIWLNDETWPERVRSATLRRAAALLRGTRGVVISYGPQRRMLPRGLRLAEHVLVETSWYGQEEIQILQADGHAGTSCDCLPRPGLEVTVSDQGHARACA